MTAQARSTSPARLAVRGLLLMLALLVAFVVVSEMLGWRYLAGTAQQKLTDTLQRRVSLTPPGASEAQWRLHLLWGVHLRVPYLEVASPEWSKAPHMVQAQNADLKLRYGDLIGAWRGGTIRIKQLMAAKLDVQAERLADGRASWQFGPPKPADASASEAARIPVFDRLEVADGTIRYDDAPLKLALLTRLTLDEGQGRVATTRGDSNAAASAPVSVDTPEAFTSADAGDAPPRGLRALTTGTYGKSPVRVAVQSSGVLAWVGGATPPAPIPFSVDASVGRAGATFVGTATDGLKFGKMAGEFTVKGPSLAAVGDAIGVTLPTTAAFDTRGKLSRDGTTWQLAVDSLAVGDTRLDGAFRYDAAPTAGHDVPLLQGRLAGQRLMLVDLAPSIGAAPKSPATAKEAVEKKPVKDGKPTKVLPDREFDLPSLRRMDANVVVDLAHLDLGSAFAEPLQPFRSHLVLNDGVLTVSGIDARTADGRVYGSVSLDGNHQAALWSTDLGWSDVRLERWLQQSRGGKQPPYISGHMDGAARLKGSGRSTAEILAGLSGTLGVEISNGKISHLVVEGAGLDVAEALKDFVTGDDALPVQCGVVQLKADRGVLTPSPMVINTPDSTIMVTGTVSLASEAMDLKAVTLPKDWSVMTFRTPVHLTGTFSNPDVSLEKKPLLQRAGVAGLLALVNPLAALIPFIETGDKDAAVKGATGCKALAERALREQQAHAAKQVSMAASGH